MHGLADESPECRADLEGGDEDAEGDGQRGAGDAGEEVEEDVADQVEEDGGGVGAPVPARGWLRLLQL